MKTKFSKWLEQNEIQPAAFAKRYRIELETLKELMSNTNAEVTHEERNKLRKAIREIDPTANTYDFWSVSPSSDVQNFILDVS
ncbi:hypothetical protein [Alicyclobacillus fodiniaquatilis]|uniref:Uncharacterized protein n=1 Tax=Alicyclobacillus fodiniaquatilis TaxID=1661150 RepID=A0ABW4JFN0_9BACL